MVKAIGSRLTRVSWIEFVDDGMIVRFAYHQPRKLFFDPGELLTFVDNYLYDMEYYGEPQQNKFKKDCFQLVFLSRNIKLRLTKPLFGHSEMILSKRKLIEDVKKLFAG